MAGESAGLLSGQRNGQAQQHNEEKEHTAMARIYGVENVYRYKRISVVNELIDPLPEEIVYTDELFEGEKKQMVYPKKGLKSAGALEKYSGEKLVERKQLEINESKGFLEIK